jgi:hypothetical protein
MSTSPAPVEPLAAPPPAARKRFEYHAIALVLCTVVLGLAMTMSVQGGTQVNLPGFSTPLPELCHSRRVFGIDCPGCGMTRCFISLGHGDVASAWTYNASGILLFGLVVAQLPYRTMQLWRLSRGRPEWRLGRLTTWLAIALGAALALQWAVKIVSTALA